MSAASTATRSRLTSTATSAFARRQARGPFGTSTCTQRLPSPSRSSHRLRAKRLRALDIRSPIVDRCWRLQLDADRADTRPHEILDGTFALSGDMQLRAMKQLAVQTVEEILRAKVGVA